MNFGVKLHWSAFAVRERTTRTLWVANWRAQGFFNGSSCVSTDTLSVLEPLAQVDARANSTLWNAREQQFARRSFLLVSLYIYYTCAAEALQLLFNLDNCAHIEFNQGTLGKIKITSQRSSLLLETFLLHNSILHQFKKHHSVICSCWELPHSHRHFRIAQVRVQLLPGWQEPN